MNNTFTGVWGHVNTSQDAVEVAFVFANCLVLLVTLHIGILANVFVAWAVYRQKSLQTSNNALLVNLAVIDSLRCVIDCPLLLIIVVSAPTAGDFGDVFCSVQVASFSLICCVQLFTLACISAERYQAVAHPFKCAERRKRITVSIILTWVVPVFISVLCFLFAKDSPVYVRCRGLSLDMLQTYNTFGLYILTPVWCACLSIIVAFYARIVLLVRAHSRKIYDKGCLQPPDKNEDTKKEEMKTKRDQEKAFSNDSKEKEKSVEAKETFGEVKETFGEAKETFGEVKEREVFGEAKKTFGEAKETFGEAKETFGEVKERETFGEAKETFGEVKETFGEAKETFGEVKERETFGEAKETFGEVKERETFREAKETFGEAKETFGEAKEREKFREGKKEETFGEAKQKKTYGEVKEKEMFGEAKRKETFGEAKGSNVYSDLVNAPGFQVAQSGTFEDDRIMNQLKETKVTFIDELFNGTSTIIDLDDLATLQENVTEMSSCNVENVETKVTFIDELPNVTSRITDLDDLQNVMEMSSRNVEDDSPNIHNTNGNVSETSVDGDVDPPSYNYSEVEVSPTSSADEEVADPNSCQGAAGKAPSTTHIEWNADTHDQQSPAEETFPYSTNEAIVEVKQTLESTLGTNGDAQTITAPPQDDMAGAVCMMPSLAQREKGNAKKESKLAKRSGYIIFTFLIFWIPLIATVVMNHFLYWNNSLTVEVFRQLEIFTVSVVCMTSFTNPIIYAAVNPQFRTEFYNLKTKWKSFFIDS